MTLDLVSLVVVATLPHAYGDGVLDIVGTTMVIGTEYNILPVKVKTVNVVLICRFLKIAYIFIILKEIDAYNIFDDLQVCMILGTASMFIKPRNFY